MDNSNSTTKSSAIFLPVTSANNLIMPFIPRITSVSIFPMVWIPMQQAQLAISVTPYVRYNPQYNTCINFRQLAPLKSPITPSANDLGMSFISIVPSIPMFQTGSNWFSMLPLELLINVFIGNISEKVPDTIIKSTLEVCGKIVSWKREKGYGLCKIYGVESALRVINILHDMDVGGKKLVVNVDLKSQAALDQFYAEKKGANESKRNVRLEVLYCLYCSQTINSIITYYNDNMIKEGDKLNIVDNEKNKNTIYRDIGKFQKVIKIVEERNRNKSNTYDRKHKQNKIKRKKKDCRKSIHNENCKAEILEISGGRYNKDRLREIEIEEEVLELIKEKNIQREEEQTYQDKCKQWEIKEIKKKLEFIIDNAKKKLIQYMKEYIALKLKEFFMNYNDEVDDLNYFKGIPFQRKFEFRDREHEEDNRDQQKEINIHGALWLTLNISDLIDLESNYTKIGYSKEENKTKLLLHIVKKHLKRLDMEMQSDKTKQICVIEKALMANLQQPDILPNIEHQIPPPEFSFMTQFMISQKRKNINVGIKNIIKEFVNLKKRKLKPLNCTSKQEKKIKAIEEKIENIRKLIEHIPPDKEDLFSFYLDRTIIDNQLILQNIRPWINEKIIEYIEEPDETLADFICLKILDGSSPQAILDEIQDLLNKKEEVFVIKMWKRLIYEIVAKKKKIRQDLF